MADPHGDRRLAQEADAFCRALVDRAPSDYVLRKYVEGHQSLPDQPVDPLDRHLLAIAQRGPFAARQADAYARFARPAGLLRRKLILLVAILESAPDTAAELNQADDAGPLITLARLAVAAASFAAVLLTAVARYAPVHVWQALTRGAR
ncbi:MAG: hypothetical protein ACOY71_00060 [Gemmatimonadota bacterium]